MDDISGLYVILFFACLIVAAFFCSAETAFISIQKLRLQHLVEKGNARAVLVARILGKPEQFLATVLLGINFFETAAATLGTLLAVSLWGESTGAAIAAISITILTLVLVEYIPKSLAARHSETLALNYAFLINIISVVFMPIVFLLYKIGIKYSNSDGPDGKARPTISEEEFRTMISVGHREGTVEKAEAEMLHNIFEFSDRPVSEVMIPRPEVVFVEKGTQLTDFLDIYKEKPLSRFPVFSESTDNIIGFLSIKDILLGRAKGIVNDDTLIDGFARTAYFTPETKPIGKLFAEMREKSHQMAIVVDEYGGTAGIVTITQLMEEIVGPVGDELSGREKDFSAINDYTFQIDGGMRIEEVNEEMELGLPEGEYETVAGFILHIMQRIPRQGEQIRHKDLKMVITRMRGVKIEEVLVTRDKPAEKPLTTNGGTDKVNAAS